MAGFMRLVRSDALKLAHTPFFALHGAVPLFGAVAFLSYLGLTEYAAAGMMGVYLQALAIVFPLIAAWVCSLVASQEIEAGGGFFMLMASSRAGALASKLVLMVAMGLVSCMLAVFAFAVGASFLQPDFAVPVLLCAQEALVLWASALFLYALHTWLSLRFGRNVNFAVAAFEMLLAALMLTGLGDTIWFAVPPAWGTRLVSSVAQVSSGEFSMVQATLPLGIGAAAAVTMILGIFLFWWIRRWEGRKSEDD